MKKLVLFILLMFLLVGLKAQNSAYGKKIYRDYGTFKLVDGGNIVSVSAFVTIQKETDVKIEKGLLTKKMLRQLKNTESKVEYHYELYFVSKSTFDGHITNTWLYGTRILINNENVFKKQFPDGFIVSVRTEPTLIYTHHADNTNIEFDIMWDKSVYEPRIRK